MSARRFEPIPPCRAGECPQGRDATRMMPQSLDQGQTVTYVATCNECAEGWWDGADWDGRNLEYPL